jgi:hypothetical protein
MTNARQTPGEGLGTHGIDWTLLSNLQGFQRELNTEFIDQNFTDIVPKIRVSRMF